MSPDCTVNNEYPTLAYNQRLHPTSAARASAAGEPYTLERMYHIDIENHLPRIQRVVSSVASRPVTVIPVSSVAGWCAERSGDGKGDPVAMSVRDGQTGAWGIVVRKNITADQVASVLDRIEIGGASEVHKRLSTPEAFVTQLILHELAHLENDWGQELENDCDRWALDRLASAL